MAFALTSFFADGERYLGPGPLKGVQRVILGITGTTADIDLDIGDDSGTFWTDAVADTTYGEMASQALTTLQKIIGQTVTWQAVYCPQIDAVYLRAAAAAASAYTLAFTNSRPNWTFDTGEGLTAYTVIIDYIMDPAISPVNIAYNYQVP